MNMSGAAFSGLVSVNLGDGVNSFTNYNYDSYNGGLSINGGSGVDTVTLGGYITAKSITLRLGDGADVLNHNGSYLTVSGLADYGMGDGANSINGYFYSANYLGGLKVTGGIGDDTLSINAYNLILAKGATFDGGRGNKQPRVQRHLARIRRRPFLHQRSSWQRHQHGHHFLGQHLPPQGGDREVRGRR